MDILDCGHPPSKHENFTTGYGIDRDGKKHCYDCCARIERESMIESGRSVLYLNEKTRKITDWAGHLSFDVPVLWHTRHNWYMVDHVTYVRFVGPDGKVWTGKHLGDNDLIYCRRTKLTSIYVA